MSAEILCRSKVKARLETAYGEWVERIPAWIKWATQVDTFWPSLQSKRDSLRYRASMLTLQMTVRKALTIENFQNLNR